MENVVKIEKILIEGVESYRLSGPFTQSGVKNRNGRVYPYNESKREILKLKEQLESGKELYLYKGHPPHSDMIREDSCAIFEEITYIDDGQNITGWCKVRTLPDTKTGKEVAESLSNGEQWGISTRGTGNVIEGVVQGWNAITADLVSAPSCQICNMRLTEELVNDLDDFLVEDCACFYSTLDETEQLIGQKYLVEQIKKLLKG